MLASQDGASRRNAAEALGWIGSASATGALVKALGDSTEVVRSEAAWALGEIGDPSAQRALARTRSGDPSAVVREAAGLALAQIGSVSATRVSGWTAWIPILSRYEEARWPLLILALFAAALLVARNAQPSPVRVARRSRGR
jgi:HEAT repeat protein